jgi:hypothetical protein
MKTLKQKLAAIWNIVWADDFVALTDNEGTGVLINGVLHRGSIVADGTCAAVMAMYELHGQEVDYKPLIQD